MTSDIPCILPVIHPAYHKWCTLYITRDISSISPVIHPVYHRWYILYITSDTPCISPVIHPAYHQWYTLYITTDIPCISPVIYTVNHQRYILNITSDIPCISPVIYLAYHQWYTLHITRDTPCISPVMYSAYYQWYILHIISDKLCIWYIMVERSVYRYTNIQNQGFCIFYLVQFVGNKHLYCLSDVGRVCKNIFHCHKNTPERTLCLGNNKGGSLLCFPHAVHFLECFYDNGRCSCTVHTADTTLVQPLSKVSICIACLVQGNV